MKKKVLLVMLALVCAVALAACGGGGDNSATQELAVIQPVDTTGMELAKAVNTDVKVAYPDAGWELNPAIYPLTIMYEETADTDKAVNISIALGGECSSELTAADLQAAVSVYESEADYITVDVQELRTYRDTNVIYLENTTAFTEEAVERLLENGSFTQADIDAFGGVQALVELPPVTQFVVFAPVDGYLFVYTASYFSAEEKQACLDAITVMIDNSEAMR